MDAEINDNLFPAPPRRNWTAQWIWIPESANYAWTNSYAFFRGKFSAGGAAIVHVAADTRYEFYLDGRLIDRGTAPADVRYKTFDSYPLELLPGEHVLAFLVHHVGEVCATTMKSRPGLFVEMEDEQGNILLATDATWKTIPGRAFRQHLPCMMSHFGFYIDCDWRRIPDGWNEPNFDDGAWLAAEVLGPAGTEPWLRLIPRDIPNLATTPKRFSRITCRGVYKENVATEDGEKRTVAVRMHSHTRQVTRQGPLEMPQGLGCGADHEFLVLDYGREVTGHVQLEFLPAADGQEIALGYDETIDSRGLPDPCRTYVHFADRYRLREGQTTLDVFEGRGFRYLLIDVAAGQGGITLTSAGVVERLYPVTRQGSFECSDADLDWLYRVAQKTASLCMLDAYVDCPSRERVMWMDAFYTGLGSVYSLGDIRLWRHCLYLFAQNTVREGPAAKAVKCYAPTDNQHSILMFIMLYVLSLREYVELSGDLATGQALWGTVQNQFEVLGRFTMDDGLLNDQWQKDNWHFIDWSAMDIGGVSGSVNAMYIIMHREAIDLARMLERWDDAARLERNVLPLRSSFLDAFWSEEERLFVDALYDGKPSRVRSQLTNVLAIMAGVIDEDECHALMERITNTDHLLKRTGGDYRLTPDFQVQCGGVVPIGTPGLAYYLLSTLCELGRGQQAIEILKQDWMPIACNGTFAEHFVLDKNSSFCHGWSVAPAIVLPRYVLGARPLEPGWKSVRIHPRPCGLDWAQGTIPTPLGPLFIRWERNQDRLDLFVEPPSGMHITTACDSELELNLNPCPVRTGR